jgi:LDH2 family malate/lactate/ureidoglycolate dehydrogenase
MAIKININISKKKFLEEMTKMSKKVYQQQKYKKNEIFLPGDKENKTSKVRLKKGIPVSKSVLFDLITISKELKINFNA